MTGFDDAAALRAEIDGLRRQYWSAVVVGLIAVGAVGVVCLNGRQGESAAAAADSRHGTQVEAQTFRLVDVNGNLRGLWHCPPAGPSLTLLDDNGRIAVAVSTDPAGLTLSVPDGRACIRLAADGAGAAVQIIGPTGEAEATLRLGATGGRLRLTDAAGRVLYERP